MARKYEIITELYQRTITGLTAPQEWQRFLTTACRNFRLSFDEQVLLFAQRPDATAVLTIDGPNGWNQRFGRWVNRGATGIAVFDGEYQGRSRLKYYFDISDTHPSRFARRVPIWTMQPEYEPEVIEALENSFGELSEKEDLASALLSAAKNAVEDNMPDYLAELRYYKENSFLEELDDLNLEVTYRNALQNSIGYMLLVRCGIDPGEYFTDDDFRCVLDFSTPETLNALGTATGDISQMCLSAISRTVLPLQRNPQRVNRTFAEGYKVQYPNVRTETPTTERSNEHERTDIHDAGRLQPAEPSAAPGGGSDPWEVRIDAPQISETEPQDHLYEPADHGQAESAPDGDRADGENPDRTDAGTDGEGRGRDGGTESRRPDEVDGSYEQPETVSGGNGAGGADLQLIEDEEPNEADSAELPAFLDERLIMAIVSNKDDDLKYKKQQIELYFSIHPEESERAEYLKGAYPDRYTELLVDGVRVGYKPQEDGLLMWEGAYLSRKSESVFSWAVIAGWTAQLIEKKEYFIHTTITPPKNVDSQQMSLFDFAGFDAPAQDDTPQMTFFSQPELPQQVIDEALCIGANDRNSRLIICAYFMKNKPLEDNTAFLQKHYGTNGAGFYIQNREYALWYGSEGLRVSTGRSAQKRYATLLTWEDAAKRIRELLDMGRYMPQSEIDRTAEYEYKTLAETLALTARDFSEEAKAAGYAPTVRLALSAKGGFPETEKQLTELLKDPDMLGRITDEWAAFVAAHEQNRDLMRFCIYRPKEILQKLQDLQREPLVFKAAEGYVPMRRFFISTDEIDKVLRGGEQNSDYRLGVYAYFAIHKDAREREKYLKNYHGEYSGYHGGNDNRTYTGKGLSFSHGDLTTPYAKVELSWGKITKRITELISADQFLSETDRAAMPDYEIRQLAREIHSFFYDTPDGMPRPFSQNPIADYWEGVNEVAEQLTDPARVEEIYQTMMLPLWESTPQDHRYYQSRKDGLDAMEAYRNGTYSVFGRAQTLYQLTAPVPNPEPAAIPTAETKPQATVEIVDDEPVEVHHLLAKELVRFYLAYDDERYSELGGEEDRVLEALEQQLHVAETRKGIIDDLAMFLDETDPEDDIAVDMQLALERIQDLPEEPDLMGKVISYEGNEPYRVIEISGYRMDDEVVLQSVNDPEKYTTDVYGFICALALRSREMDEAKELIDEYCQEVFDQGADFSDLSHVDLAFSATADSEHTVEIFADLTAYRLVYQVDGETVYENVCESLSDLNVYLANLDFDVMVAQADEWYQQKHTERTEETAVIAGVESPTETVARYQTDDEIIVIQRYPNGRYYNQYGYDVQTGIAASTAGGFETLEEAENAIHSHRPTAVKAAEPAKEQPEKETQVLAPPKPKRERVVFTTLHPEIPADKRRNFRITDDELGYGTASEKYAANVAAIRCLKRIEAEERLATPEEQEVLSRYVGWGGLADCFDERHGKYLELKSLLDEEEYVAARANSLTAFYTSPVIIRAMYQALEQMGFRQGNLLEPSCGVGNFIGMLPESMADSKAYGVEIDAISGRIAQQLYQNSSIAVNGFEKVQMPDSFFDVAIGNVPFGDFKVRDKKYDKNHWLIHDYFFGKTLDKVRPGGIVAFITSKGTMDKENSAVRKYLAQRADLIGAIRLPNNAFKRNAGTEVTSDIIFLQKKDRMTDIEPDWVHLDTDENGIRMNSYFVQHPEMVLGEMVMESTRFGMDSTCRAYEGVDLSDLLSEAVQNLHAQITEYEVEELEEDDHSIPADSGVRNFSYAIVDGKVYYRENSRMHPIAVSVTAENRIRGMIALRDCVRRLIEAQTENYPDEDILKEQAELNRLYDGYTAKYGLLSSRGNSLAFSEDSSYCLLCSLEVLDEEGNLKRKADMFTKRTIRPHEAVTSVDTASEALAVSISEKARVDMEYMAELSGKSEEELAADLSGVIFRDIQCAEDAAAIPRAFVELERFAYVAADEYLSGNVRRKLRMAKALYEVLPAEKKPQIAKNIEALEAVQPVDLTAAEIGVRIGANWIPVETYQKFMVETFGTSFYARSRIKILRSGATGQWGITEKNADRGNIKVSTTYGSKRMNAYAILEQTLNQRDVRVFDYVEDENGNKKPVLNKKETAIAQDRQELIKQKFSEWIWKDIDRREELCHIYNETFNSVRPREYDGSHIRFSGMNPEIILRKHQTNAIAHILYGGNTLLAHAVGAGKTYEIVAAAMEMKRLGLCTKSLIVVPNHITEQWAAEWLQLYPSANILVATRKDFETRNRKKFCARIATGDYDAVIIGHSQFEKIPVSAERQAAILQQQIDEIMFGIEEAKAAKAERYTVKQLERTRKSLEARLEKLNDQSRKDDLVTFEELGVDRVFVDESHGFKNCAKRCATSSS